MNAELTLYTINIIGNIGQLIGIIGALLFLLFIILFIMYFDRKVIDGYENDDEYLIKIKKYLKLSLILLTISGVAATIIPDRKTMYMMASTHYLKKSDIPSKVLEILNHKLDEIITENKKG